MPVCRILRNAGAAASTALLLSAACGSSSPVWPISCAGRRVVVVDLSSQHRAPGSVKSTEEVLAAHLLGAAACREAVSALGVAGGSQVPLFDGSNALAAKIDGPNLKARTKQARNLYGEALELVSTNLVGAFRDNQRVATTSVPALYAAAAEHALQGGRVVVLTTGVNIDDRVDLNRPLGAGEGGRLAGGLDVPTMPKGTRVVVSGVTLMDADRPAPGSTWPAEVRAFNDRLCAATGAHCQLFSVASVAETRP